MSNRKWIGKIQVLQVMCSLLLVFCSPSSSLPCDDNRCKTGSCDKNGACVCNLPDASTVLEGDRTFLGGEFCDEERTMCDGTNSFWCEHGGSCDEIVHGENYTCKCSQGYSGVHCEHIGAPCGQIFCFHEAECLVESELCGCPLDWRGSADCSLPTATDPMVNSTSTSELQEESSGTEEFVRITVICGGSLGLAVGVAILTKKYLKRRVHVGPKFQQLSEMHVLTALDDEESIDNNVEHR